MIKKFNQFVLEKTFHEVFPKKNSWYELNPKQALEFSKEFFEIVDQSYSYTGGYAGIKNHKEFEKEIKEGDLTFFCLDNDEDEDADSLVFGKENNKGFKITGIATDGSNQSKKDVLDAQADNLKKKNKHFFCEASGRIAEIFINKYKVPIVTDEKTVREVLKGKEIEWLGEDSNNVEGWYKRKINGELHSKILLGNPKMK